MFDKEHDSPILQIIIIDENTMISSDLDGGVILWDIPNMSRIKMIREFEMKT